MAQVERATSTGGKLYVTDTTEREDVIGENIVLPIYTPTTTAERDAILNNGSKGIKFGDNPDSPRAFISTIDHQYISSGTVGIPSNEKIWTRISATDSVSMRSENVSMRATAPFSASSADVSIVSDNNAVYIAAGDTIQLGNWDENLLAFSVLNNTTASASNVHCTAGGLIQRSTSARKYKTDIEPLEPQRAIDFVKKAQPIWYRSKCEADNKDYSYYGYIADDVAKFEPRLVNFNEQGEPEGFAYERVTALLHTYIKEQDKRINDLENRIKELEKR